MSWQSSIQATGLGPAGLLRVQHCTLPGWPTIRLHQSPTPSCSRACHWVQGQTPAKDAAAKDMESGSDTAAGSQDGEVPAVGAGHPERTPGVLRDMRKSRVFGALTKARSTRWRAQAGAAGWMGHGVQRCAAKRGWPPLVKLPRLTASLAALPPCRAPTSTSTRSSRPTPRLTTCTATLSSSVSAPRPGCLQLRPW